MNPDEIAAITGAAPTNPAPTGQPVNPETEQLKTDQRPAWADELLSHVEGVNERLNQFEERLTAPQEIGQEQPKETDYQPPKTWQELEQRSREIAAREYEEREAARKKAEADAKAAEDAELQKTERYLDEQIAMLEQNNILPKVTNQADKNDPGRQARAELYGYAHQMGTLNLIKAAETLQHLHKTGMRYDPQEGKLVTQAGSNAPGASAPLVGSTTTNPTAPQPVSQNMLARYSMDEIAEIADRAIPG